MAVTADTQASTDGAPRQRGGAKLNRSETVTVRLDPRLNYLCELAARAQRRTKSSFIEWAVEAALSTTYVPGTGGVAGSDASIDGLAGGLWSVDEAERLAALAFDAPILMTHEEQLVWKQVRENGWVWRGRYKPAEDGSGEEEWTWAPSYRDLLRLDQLRDHFEKFKAVGLGEADRETLPRWTKRRKQAPAEGWAAAAAGAYDDLDDDIPF